jgi:dTDP-4-dehydrorhamnose 3,5-epimerase
MIEGVILTGLDEKYDDKGSVLHMIKSSSRNFCKFGEIYFSEIVFGKFKGWKLHKKQTQNICVPVGRVRFYLYDLRDYSETYKQASIIELSRDINYNLLTIPPGIWYGFQGVNISRSILANLVDIPHDPEESIKLPELNKFIPIAIDYEL